MNIQKIVAKLPIGIQVRLNRHDYEYEGKCRIAGYMKGVTFKCRKCGESYFLLIVKESRRQMLLYT